MSANKNIPNKKWLIKHKRVQSKSKNHTQDIVSLLLQERDIENSDELRAFLYPNYELDVHSPFLFQNMNKAVSRIFEAVDKQEPIVVFGDYDADGVTSSTILYKTLKKIGANILTVYIPHREDEGYGLNINAVQNLADRGAKLLITLDCGTTNVDEVEFARNLGVEVIVADHHFVPEKVANCYALINAKAPDEKYPFEHLAGAGATFKLSQALLRSLADKKPVIKNELKAFEKWLLDLVAIATVTDLVPLTGENRVLLKYGLMVLNRTKRPGLKALIDRVGATGRVTPEIIAFQLGPRLNAPGRMAHAELAFKLLSTDDEEEGQELAEQLEQLNRERQKITETMSKEAEMSLIEKDSNVVVAVGDGWPAGLVGLVASRLTEKFSRPSLVITVNDNGVMGSGRSIPSFNIIEAFHNIKDEVFIKFGGHAQACGFTLTNRAAALDLHKNLSVQLAERLTDEDLIPILEITTDVGLDEMDWPLYSAIQLLEPFGMNNSRPLLVVSAVCVASAAVVGATQKHLRITFTDNNGTVRQGIGFGLAHKLDDINMGDMVDVVAELTTNEWNGNKDLQLRIHDLRKSV